MRVIIVVREPDSGQPDHSLEFELPAVPEIGSYISIQRPDAPRPEGEDLVVRYVWWQLDHPSTGERLPDDEPAAVGIAREIVIECDPAIGPYSSKDWRQTYEGIKGVSTMKIVRRPITQPKRLRKPKAG